MRRATSVSLGSPTRDKVVQLRLLGKDVRLERVGTHGDVRRARQLFRELDGKVDALGVGGVNLSVNTPWRRYPLYAALQLVQDVSTTPYTDGSGLHGVLERRVMQIAGPTIDRAIRVKKVFLVEAISRPGMLSSFLDAGYECIYGDLMFALGIPVPIRSLGGLNALVRLLLPIVGRLPISAYYSIGETQETIVPKYERWYRECPVIAGDWLYIRRHLPDDLEGKVIVTNTTTAADVELMRERGVRYLVTTTPVIEGRSFGTNATEAALVAAAGKGRLLSSGELEAAVREAGFAPTVREPSW